jgi:prepilin-type N-terminal cleavage/methylation domain-containing protein
VHLVRSRRRARAGFSLMELLVAIAVIVVLVGLSIPAISAVRRRSQVKECNAFLELIKLKVMSYADEFGDFPPSDARRAGLPRGNGQNDGAEVLLRCMTTTRKGGPFFEFKDEQLGNLDDDRLTNDQNPTSSTFATRELYEVLDGWGNPLGYLHNADYDKGITVQLLSGQGFVAAAKSDKTGQFLGLTTFQLWSAGPDGLAATEDDIVVFGEQ